MAVWKRLSSLPVLAALIGPPAYATDAQPDVLYDAYVSDTILDTVSSALPESRQVGAEFLNSSYDPNLHFTNDSQVAVTFISEGAGYKNSLGYFSYQSDAFDNVSFADIDSNSSGNITARELSNYASVNDVGIIFGNASGAGGYAGWGGSLNTGDTWVIGDGSYSENSDGSWTMENGQVFDQGSSLGFFVSANSWNGRGVNGWDNNRDNPTYYSVDMLNPENPSSATADNVSDVARHTAMLNIVGENQLLLGFEDLRRPYGDNDFNDAVFIIRTTPEDGYTTEEIAQVFPTMAAVEGGGGGQSQVSAAPSPDIGALGGLVLAGLAFLGFRRKEKG